MPRIAEHVADMFEVIAGSKPKPLTTPLGPVVASPRDGPVQTLGGLAMLITHPLSRWGRGLP